MRLYPILIFLALWLSVVFSASSAHAVYGVEDKYLPKEPIKISMDFKNAELTDVLKVLSQQSGMNFVASSALEGKIINLYLQNVPVDEALDKILLANNLTYEMDGDSNVFIVKPSPKASDLMTRVYFLKYATVSASKMNKTLNFGEETSGLSGSGKGSDDEKKEATTGIVAAVKAVLTEAGSLVEDTRTNSLTVTDVPSQFGIIEQTIGKLDVRIPQVLIEVEMLDVSKNDADKIGVKFGETPFFFSGSSKETYFPFTAPDGAESFDVGTLSYQGLQVTMNFLKTQTDAKSLATPRIMTLNNETAEIRIETDEAIALNQTQTSAEGAATTSLEAERVLTGVFLRVTPQINTQSQEITMAIEPKVVQAKEGDTFNGQTVKDPETRGTKSILRVKDGDTVVLGGLIRNEDAETKVRVPFLSDIPLVGGAFRHRDRGKKQRELVVFITPHIVLDNGQIAKPSTMNKDAQDSTVSADRLNAINKELTLFEQKGSNP